LGLVIERGSSSRGGASGLKAMVKRLRGGLDVAFAVDGPRGPRGVVHRGADGRIGAALAAGLAQGVGVPMGSAGIRPWGLRAAWAQLELPRPFSRVAVALGPPLEPLDLTPHDLAGAIDRARHAAVGALRG